MAVEFKARTDVGVVREHNEDNFIIDEKNGLFVVADGLGGQAAGEVASEMAIKIISDFIKMTELDKGATWPVEYKQDLTHAHNRLSAAIERANVAIFRRASEDTKKQGMGTTAVCALVEKNLLQLAHVGDSRAYLFRDDTLQQLTRDHTWVNEQVKNGLLSEEEAVDHPYKNIITRALGASEKVEIEHADFELEDGDIALICSDGLTTMLTDEDIRTILILGEGILEETIEALIDKANDLGGKDNITVILMRFAEDRDSTGSAPEVEPEQ